jgi:hypothetical protein
MRSVDTLPAATLFCQYFLMSALVMGGAGNPHSLMSRPMRTGHPGSRREGDEHASHPLCTIWAPDTLVAVLRSAAFAHPVRQVEGEAAGGCVNRLTVRRIAVSMQTHLS